MKTVLWIEVVIGQANTRMKQKLVCELRLGHSRWDSNTTGSETSDWFQFYLTYLHL